MTLLKKLLYFAGPLLLLILTAIAGHAYSTIQTLSLPISEALALLTVLLPLFAGVSGHGARRLILKSKRNGNPQLTIPLLAIIGLQLIYETVIATLALTHILPTSSLTCGLNTKWEELFRSKNEHAIRTIQDRFDCCGRNTLVDRAWPFGNPSTCPQTFNRNQICFGPWRQAEQTYAGLLLLVAICVFIMKIMSLISLLTTSSWAHPKWAIGHVEEAEEEPEDDARATMRGLIEQSAGGNEYHDEPNGQTRNQAIDSAQSQAPRVQPSSLIENGNEWRDEEMHTT